MNGAAWTCLALPLAGDEPLVWRGLWTTYWHAVVHVPPGVHYAVSGSVTTDRKSVV